eukprot:CAMPEP_0179187532 /NCGR_PEP_ID=MMETSP0796-20121207/93057_1 /TAXON_ID=73915 /ORGANISM="Pyrodinium bahamense, Strain pbaha01" /LENGTH=105 /DNA_ID=CAMNT_0020891603 /DNA_START=83 /DNA_END=399 /DNA_ORIENTATION=-
MSTALYPRGFAKQVFKGLESEVAAIQQSTSVHHQQHWEQEANGETGIAADILDHRLDIRGHERDRKRWQQDRKEEDQVLCKLKVFRVVIACTGKFAVLIAGYATI